MKQIRWNMLPIIGIGVLLFGGCPNPADPDSPGETAGNTVHFTALSANGSETATTSRLTLTFDQDISGLSAEDILLEPGNTGAGKGVLTRTGTGTYTLEIEGITSTGTVTLSASKTGYTITGNPKQVTVFQYTPPVDIAVAFTALSADGSEIATTSAVTLTFDQDISGLSAEDILLNPNETGALKGSLSKTGTGVYSLAISGITNAGEIEMQVSKAGYVVSPASRTVTVHYRYTYAASIQVTLQTDWELLDQAQSIAQNTVTVFSTSSPYGDYGSYQWYLDGAPVGTGPSYTYDSQNAQAGDIYEIAVVAGNGAGETRSGRCRITITN
jgi:hypothetical protein